MDAFAVAERSQDRPAEQDLILVLDFGAQYTQLIARRVRECKVFCEVLPCDTLCGDLAGREPAGIILSGGPASVYEPGAPRMDPEVYRLGVPVLGICYGHQLMAMQLGGVVEPAERHEYGRARLTVTEPGSLFEGVAERGEGLECWMSHGDLVQAPPPGFKVLATTTNAPIAAMADETRRLYAVQFHPEVAHTPFGRQMLRAFLYGPCGCRGSWTASGFVQRAVAEITARVGDDRVVCGVSGGVDSCCVAALVHRAVGDRLTCVFVDHGLLRKGEAEQVRDEFAGSLGLNLVCVDVGERFLNRLAGVTDPEAKRKIIGTEFVRVFEEHADNIPGVRYLAQGTLYPDVIESGGGHAAVIKTHHNVGGLPEDMHLEVIEPVRMLFKDEVRAVAVELGLPGSIVWRHPFPGPGLAIRVLGEVTREGLDLLREADAIFIDELKSEGLYDQVWQAFAVLTGVRSVGVMGDQRTYGNTVVLRAVTSDDAMTAACARLPHPFLEHVGNRIVNEVPGVNRVTYDVTSKPPATIEWE